MLKLIDVNFELKQMMEPYFRTENSRSADFCFGNIYMWDKRYKQSVAPVEGRLVTRLVRHGETYFAFPVGEGDLRPAINEMLEICRSEGIPLKTCGITDEHIGLLYDAFGGCFELSEDRAYSDYIYRADKLSTYSGRAMHAKKNFCNRFENEHEWRFVPITKEMVPECVAMLDEWTEESEGRLTHDIGYEHDAILRGFSHYDELGLMGGALYSGERLLGFSVGEVISDDTFCTHFEKAYPDVAGAYPMVCRELVRMVCEKNPKVCYVNREDDMGNEALRQSKLSYKPEYILNKYVAVWKT